MFKRLLPFSAYRGGCSDLFQGFYHFLMLTYLWISIIAVNCYVIALKSMQSELTFLLHHILDAQTFPASCTCSLALRIRFCSPKQPTPLINRCLCKETHKHKKAIMIILVTLIIIWASCSSPVIERPPSRGELSQRIHFEGRTSQFLDRTHNMKMCFC